MRRCEEFNANSQALTELRQINKYQKTLKHVNYRAKIEINIITQEKYLLNFDFFTKFYCAVC